MSIVFALMNFGKAVFSFADKKIVKILLYFERGFRAFHASNIGYVGQRATKLQSFKL